MNLKSSLASAVAAARAAGVIIRKNLNAPKKINARTAHDIKLELDVRCQNLIEKKLHAAFPEIAFLGEEGSAGDANADHRWVVDPIDGTVNYTYGIPHACVCIALQKKVNRKSSSQKVNRPPSEYETVVGVIYDPFQDEMWTASTTDPARLNGKRIQVSQRKRLEECVCVMGYGKNEEMIRKSLKLFQALTLKSRKLRNMGSAGLGLAYVACGRFDAYIESGVSLWDIAAGGFIVERAGGEFWRESIDAGHGYRMITSNGRLRKQIAALR